MYYDWKRFLEFSEELFSVPIPCRDETPPVTSYRVILSRIYYAAFHVAKNFLITHQMSSSSAGAEHEKVISAFQFMKQKDQDFQTTCKRVGNWLNRLKVKRIDADYRGEYIPKEADVLMGIKNSKRVIQSLDQLEKVYYRKK